MERYDAESNGITAQLNPHFGDKTTCQCSGTHPFYNIEHVLLSDCLLFLKHQSGFDVICLQVTCQICLSSMGM